MEFERTRKALLKLLSTLLETTSSSESVEYGSKVTQSKGSARVYAEGVGKQFLLAKASESIVEMVPILIAVYDAYECHYRGSCSTCLNNIYIDYNDFCSVSLRKIGRSLECFELRNMLLESIQLMCNMNVSSNVGNARTSESIDEERCNYSIIADIDDTPFDSFIGSMGVGDRQFADPEVGVCQSEVASWKHNHKKPMKVYNGFPIMSHHVMDGRLAAKVLSQEPSRRVVKCSRMYKRLVIQKLKYQPEKLANLKAPVLSLRTNSASTIAKTRASNRVKREEDGDYQKESDQADDFEIKHLSATPRRSENSGLRVEDIKQEPMINTIASPWGAQGPIRGITWHKLHQVWEVRWYELGRRRCKTFSVKKLGGNVGQVLQDAKGFLALKCDEMTRVNELRHIQEQQSQNYNASPDDPLIKVEEGPGSPHRVSSPAQVIQMIAGRKRRSTPEAHVSRKRYARDGEGRRSRITRRIYNQLDEDPEACSSPRPVDGHQPEPFPSIESIPVPPASDDMPSAMLSTRPIITVMPLATAPSQQSGTTAWY